MYLPVIAVPPASLSQGVRGHVFTCYCSASSKLKPGYERSCIKPGYERSCICVLEVMYLPVIVIDFASFYDFVIGI
jgi:hypothetical protein